VSGRPVRPVAEYEVRVRGHLADRWAATLADGLTLTREADGTTTLRGPVRDQAALHGLLARVRDLGLDLIAVAPARNGRPAG
jgi:hypothetical protein